MSRNSLRLSRWLAPLILLCPFAADAHIQWFTQVDLSGRPQSPWEVMTSPTFVGIALLAMAVLAVAGGVDAWLRRMAPRQHLVARVQGHDIGDRGLLLMRLGMAFFFISNVLFFRDAPVILTPELKTSSFAPDVVQLAIAGLLLAGRARLAAAGIVGLFLWGAADYGMFHLMAYPIFLGIAAYLAFADAGPKWRARVTTLLRVTVAVTLLWGGIEKWLFPQWTYPLLCGSGKALTMGLPPDFFMQAAGFIEFCLAFVLIVGSVAARVAALALNVVFLGAIPMFGMIDVIGHAPFVIALVLLARSPNALAARFVHVDLKLQGRRWATAFAGALGALPAMYYAAHEMAFGRLVPAPVAIDFAIVLPVVGVIVALVTLRGAAFGRRAGVFA